MSKGKSYEQKVELICQNSDAVVDPYEIPQKTRRDGVSLWPPLEFGQIYSYLIDTPGEFMKEKLKAYKSLDVFNYCYQVIFRSISLLLFFKCRTSTVAGCRLLCSGHNCVLTAKVRASQRISSDPHDAWVCLY